MLEDENILDEMPIAALTRALQAARARVARVERERAELDRMIATAQEEERLLDRLLALRRGSEVSDPVREDKPAEGISKQRGTLRKPETHPVVIAVLDELEVARRPLHISDLVRLLHQRNVTIPGSGTQANLITYLRRDDRIVRPSRGMYGLKVWGLSNMAATTRRRKRRKRMRSTVSDYRRPEV
jgi:hypothetical protein